MTNALINPTQQANWYIKRTPRAQGPSPPGTSSRFGRTGIGNMSSGNVLDPATGEYLPDDTIQRVLFIARAVHVYSIPPLISMKGYTAADWTAPDPRTGQSRQIFTARLRILETAIPASDQKQQQQQQERVKTDILLEDPGSGDLFAAAPYIESKAVEHVLDSSRFFALRVVGDGRKAVLGIGFEDRSEAFDFGVTLQEARKVLGFGERIDEGQINNPGRGGNQVSPSQLPESFPEKDYTLKPGQTISVNVGKWSSSLESHKVISPATAAKEDEKALFSIPPPPPPASSTSPGEQADRRRRRAPSTVATD
jgi:adaptin ear-binding coat-associated protein 1/2